MYGVLEFYKECQRTGHQADHRHRGLHGARPSRAERPARRGRVDDSGGDTEGGKKLYYHLTLLAENQTGLPQPHPALEPRVPRGLLLQAAHRLGAARAVPRRPHRHHRMPRRARAAVVAAGRREGRAGQGRPPAGDLRQGQPVRRAAGPRPAGAARHQPEADRASPKRIGAPLLATNDSHYTHRDDHEAHDALLCVQTGATLSRPEALQVRGPGALPEDRRRDALPLPRASRRRATTRCGSPSAPTSNIEFGKPQLPELPDAPGRVRRTTPRTSTTSRGRAPGADGATRCRRRSSSASPTSCRPSRTWGSPRTSSSSGTSSTTPRSVGIRVGPGRGSAAGCAVAYCLRITDLDPIKYDLLFERFLNPSRISMPDIDMDFDSRYRDEMIRYAADRYGRDHVAQIITFGTIKARNAVRDAARVLGYPYGVGDKIAKAMPPLVMGRDTPLKYCFEQSPKYADGYKAAAELRAMYDADPDVKRVVDVARGLEGLKRSDGIHAAAVVITKDPLTDVPADPAQARVRPEPGRRAGRHPVRDARRRGPRPAEDGLPRAAQPRRHHRHGGDGQRARAIPSSTSTTIPLDDAATFDAARSRATRWACSSSSRRRCAQLLRSMTPTSFDDVAALIALYRPGPMSANMHYDYADRKNGRKPVEYFHPDAEEVLGDTYGLMIYQESVMRVAQKFAGYSLAEADNLRKAMGKKSPRDDGQGARRRSRRAACAPGYGAAARQAAVRHHRASSPTTRSTRATRYGYGLVTYQTAYLKAHYPVEYLACLLTSVKSNLDKAAVYLADCRSIGRQGAAARRQPFGHRLRRARRRPRCRPTSSCRAAARARSRSACRRSATSARVSSTCSLGERDENGAVRRLPRLRRACARAGAEQAHRRVAHQGRRLRLARPPPAGPAAWCSSRSSTPR